MIDKVTSPLNEKITGLETEIKDLRDNLSKQEDKIQHERSERIKT